jgi:hypothetical protein
MQRGEPAEDKKNDVIKFQSTFKDYDRCQFRYECPE